VEDAVKSKPKAVRKAKPGDRRIPRGYTRIEPKEMLCAYSDGEVRQVTQVAVDKADTSGLYLDMRGLTRTAPASYIFPLDQKEEAQLCANSLYNSHVYHLKLLAPGAKLPCWAYMVLAERAAMPQDSPLWWRVLRVQVVERAVDGWRFIWEGRTEQEQVSGDPGEFFVWRHLANQEVDRRNLEERWLSPFGSQVRVEMEKIANMLLVKNRRYGNSVLNPLRVFSKSDAIEQLRVRIDDKLSRILNRGDQEDEDVVMDLIGYLVLYRIAGSKLWD